MEPPPSLLVVTLAPEPFEPGKLPLARTLVDVEGWYRLVLFGEVVVHADDDLLAQLDGLLEAVSALGNLSLRKASFDRLHHPAHAINPIEVLESAVLHVLREALDEIRATERINEVGHATFVRDD